MELTIRQRREVQEILRRKQERGDGVVTLLTENTKFNVGDVATLIMDDWGVYFDRPKQVLILEVFSHMNSSYGERPEVYIVELEDGRIDSGYSPKQLFRKENVYGY